MLQLVISRCIGASVMMELVSELMCLSCKTFGWSDQKHAE